MAFLVDTNILVYRFDPRYPQKLARARQLFRDGVASGELRLPHQALVEFVAVVRRVAAPGRGPLLSAVEAKIEVERMMAACEVCYPTASVLRLALATMLSHQVSWFDAHLLAYAEHYTIPILYSEDFTHNGLYGSVRVINPFLEL
ncbi:MAG: PIN domain-containing protein [Deltaproteobacteria bacterium]|nr:PIN domain-containing protein [Deltaproteobacteria bacterium]